MQPHLSTTPFGRRMLTLAHVASQTAANSRPPDKAVHKWNVFRDICAAKARVGVSERALAVLDALLSFHPETALAGANLIVFPSNAQLALRAHGMAPATLRRHLAALVDAGIIVRRDSPNGKRYARKGRGGDIELAFGFDLGPIVARAEEFAAWAEEVRAEERALKLARERITLCRRDIAKMIAAGIEEGVPTRRGGQGPANWADVHTSFRALVGQVQRNATRAQLEPIAEGLAEMADDVFNLLETHNINKNKSANESQSERHKQNSKTDSLPDFEPSFQKSWGETSKAGSVVGPDQPVRVEAGGEQGRAGLQAFPLGMVLDACPNLAEYSRGGIANWRDFVATAAVVRSMLGVSPSAWEEARAAMGDIPAAIVVAAILQRGEAIASAGGYLRNLTAKAEVGEFSIGPMLMALIGARRGGKKRA